MRPPSLPFTFHFPYPHNTLKSIMKKMQIKQTHHLPLITLNNHYGIKMRQKRENRKKVKKKEGGKKLGNDPLENVAARRRRATMMST